MSRNGEAFRYVAEKGDLENTGGTGLGEEKDIFANMMEERGGRYMQMQVNLEGFLFLVGS